ncbi:MAG: Crp/Fnr family transcriptional regulator, partial [Alphaproteobacteria bacterium]|nr:Crp/Fnr family transcriptional regulator [Alphaproteobacteria bacterium]
MPVTLADLAQIRAMSPFLASLPKAAARRLVAVGRSHHWARGSVLFRVGETPEHVFMLLHGLVGFRVPGLMGKPALVGFVSAGEPFMLSPVLLGLPYLLNAEVLRDSRVLIVPCET